MTEILTSLKLFTVLDPDFDHFIHKYSFIKIINFTTLTRFIKYMYVCAELITKWICKKWYFYLIKNNWVFFLHGTYRIAESNPIQPVYWFLEDKPRLFHRSPESISIMIIVWNIRIIFQTILVFVIIIFYFDEIKQKINVLLEHQN